MTSCEIRISGRGFLPKTLVYTWVSFCKKMLNKELKCCSLELSYLNKDEMSRIHEVYCNQYSDTDCITTKYTQNGEEFGRIYVSYSVAEENAKRHATSPEFEEMLYILHSMLHLSGYVDHTMFKSSMILKTKTILEIAYKEKVCSRYITKDIIRNFQL